MSRMISERRAQSPGGRSKRAQFDASLQLLHAMGLSERATDYCRQQARIRHCLPHQLAAEMVESEVIEVMQTLSRFEGLPGV